MMYRRKYELNGGICYEPIEVPDREALGRCVRETWIEWAKEQTAPKNSWLVPWDELAEPDREVDRRIGEAIVRLIGGGE